MSKNNRPLSPHLQVYRPQITSMLSIFHRATGAALGVGAVLITVWLLAILMGDGAFDAMQTFRQSFIGKFMMFGWLFSFVYHFLNGIRHLKWDMVFGFNLKDAYVSGWVVIVGSIVITLYIWMNV